MNIETARVSADGVDGLYWPVGTLEGEPVIERMATACAPVARDALAGGKVGCEAFQVAMHHVLVAAYSVFNAQLVVERLRVRGCDADFPAHYTILRELAAGRPPAMPAIVRILSKGPAPLSLPRLPLRVARDLAVQRHVKRRRFVGPDYGEDTITSTISPLIEVDAANQASPVTFRRPNLWFSAVADGDVEPCRARIDTGLVDDIVQALGATFDRSGICMDPLVSRFFREFVSLTITLVDHHLRSVLDRPSRVPGKLWTGTGGDIWSRILRQAVRVSGGEITGHDHALGEGHLAVIGKTIVELELCDRFVTRNSHQARGIANGVRQEMLIQEHVPEITHVRAVDSGYQPKPAENLRRTDNALRVMIVGTNYPADTMRYGAVLPDIISLDWHARLMGWLRKNGHHPVFKPHPESFTHVPASLDALCERIEQPFEKVMDQADLFLFDCHSSTTLRDAMLSDRPIVYVDFGLAPFFPEAREQFSRRCAVVDGWFDEHNRAQVDWEQLGEALTHSQSLSDFSFVRDYLL